MAFEITNNTILKPWPSSPPHPLANTLVPLTIFDLAAMDLHVPTIYAFRAPMPSNDELNEGLRKVLVHYPHLSGRMLADDHKQPCFVLNNAGVRLVEASVSASLAEKLPLEATTELTDLHPPVEGVEELFQVQLNRYTCGGLVIGVTSHHRVADGQSMSQFLVAWAETVRNSTTPTPTPSPYLDRTATTVPRSPPHSEFNHLDIEFKESSKSSTTTTITNSVTPNTTTANFTVRFSADFIATLKSQVPYRSSTFECLLAHVWRKITVARGLDDDELTQVRIAVNGRARMRPVVPMQFFGNLVLWAHPRARAGELVRLGHAHAVSVIRNAVSRINDGYFKSFIDFGETLKENNERVVGSAPESGSALCPNLEVDSWLRFNFHELDFGSGGPCAFLPPNLPVEGLMVFVPSCKEKGGVDVFMALFEEHAEVFKNICYSLG